MLSLRSYPKRPPSSSCLLHESHGRTGDPAPVSAFLTYAPMPEATIHIAMSDNAVDRLPTILASQALQEARAEAANTISFALEKLDTVLQGKQHGADVTSGTAGGLRRGQVTEIHGPPGVGKTALW